MHGRLAICVLFCFISVHVHASYEIVPEKEHLITDLSVVNDSRTEPGGPWHMGSVLKNLASGDVVLQDRSNYFVESWMQQWPNIHQVNGYSVSPRNIGYFDRIWPQGSYARFDLEQIPFLLLAIVFRADLKEGRLVYGAIDPAHKQPIEFTVIFEFHLPGSLRGWVKDMHSLGALPFGEEYNHALEKLVERFATRNNLAQVRTNDFFLDFTWEMREFRLDSEGLLSQTTTAQTPDISFNLKRQFELIDWIDKNRITVEREEHVVPARFLGGAAPVENEGFSWLSNANLPRDLKEKFSRNTCNGCHAGDTRTRFTHISPRDPYRQAQISEFLTSDLARRSQAMEEILSFKEVQKPYKRVH